MKTNKNRTWKQQNVGNEKNYSDASDKSKKRPMLNETSSSNPPNKAFHETGYVGTRFLMLYTLSLCNQ